jgi:hypothetical protein
MRRLNLAEPPVVTAPPQAQLGSQRQHGRHSPETAGPLHGRPGRKSPPRKQPKKKLSDVWTFTELLKNGRRTCLFCKYVKFLCFWQYLIFFHQKRARSESQT